MKNLDNMPKVRHRARMKHCVSTPGVLFSSALPFCLFRKRNLEATGSCHLYFFKFRHENCF